MTLLAPETIDLGALPSLPLVRRVLLPDSPGIYFVLCDGPSAPLYIGQTYSLYHRWLYHEKLHYFLDRDLQISWIITNTLSERLMLEKACIRHWKPQHNRRDVRVIPEDTKQIAVRVDPLVVRKARFYLDEEHKTLQEFLCNYINAYVDQRDRERQCPRAAVAP